MMYTKATDNIDEIEMEDEENYISYRIMNLEGAWLKYTNGEFTFNSKADKKYVDKSGKTVIVKANVNKLYTVTLPYSLETIRAFEKVQDEEFNIGDDLATKLFVNFKFTKDYIDDADENLEEIKIKKKKLRELVYTSKVTIDSEEYCFFKRGASKARTANVIFCKKKYYNLLFDSCLLGLKFEKDNYYNITEQQAYISLIMSGIIGTIDIKPSEILIVPDLMSPEFNEKQTVTKLDESGHMKQYKDTYPVVNNCTDGEILLDELIFRNNKFISHATTALLRNDFFKGNAIRTRLQAYYRVNKIPFVYDMYRGWIDSKKIKMVITPSSCKYLKFYDQFIDRVVDNVTTENIRFEAEKLCFLDWLQHLSSIWGVVKTDHVGKYGYSNRLSYQMLNSMFIDKETLKTKIMDKELEYFKLLKDNTLVDNYKGMGKKKRAENRETRNQMSYFLDLVNNKKQDDNSKSSDMISDLLKINDDFRLTPEFKDWKKEQLRDYVSNLRLGKIRIPNSVYAIMVSCPFEFLLSTTTLKNKVESCVLDAWECYCPTFDKDNKQQETELLAIRNPQINAGNIVKFINKWHDHYKWFGYYKKGRPQYDFVVFVNSWNIDCMNRLQGCDWDVDSCFLASHEELVKHATEAKKWLTPVNGIKGNTVLKKYNEETLGELDNYLGGSTQLIGKIVNKSAIFNSYMYNGIKNGKNQSYIDACYNASSTLSSCSQISIDMAKKEFSGLKLYTQLNHLNQTSYINEDNKQEQVLQFKMDMDNINKVKISLYLTEYNKKKLQDKINKDNPEYKPYEMKYLLADDESSSIIQKYIDVMEGKIHLSELEIKELENNKNDKVNVHMVKMVVPKFFEYTAQDNTYRIPTSMDCSMDYLEEILDELDTKAMQTDNKNIRELFIMQKELGGKAFNRDKVDKVRYIIDSCQSTINKNRYSANDDGNTKKEKANLRKWAKKHAVSELKNLKLNEKTVYRILQRALDMDKEYKGNTLYKKDKDGNVLSYFDYDYDEEFVLTVRELKKMTMLTLTLLHKSYKDAFLKCFIHKNTLDENKVEEFWK